MNSRTLQVAPADALDAVFDRCAGLGLVSLMMRWDGQVLRRTAGWPQEGAAAAHHTVNATGQIAVPLPGQGASAAPLVAGWVSRIAAQLASGSPGEFVHEMIDGAWLAGQLAPDGRAVLVRSAAGSGGEALVVAKNLRRMSAEMATERDSAELVREFSSRLAQSFEETAAVFRILRLMTSRDEPAGQLELVCNIVQQALPFRWVGAVFCDSPCVLETLRGRLLLAGEVPGGASAIAAPLLALASGIGSDDWTRVQAVGAGAVADAAGADVVYDPIMHDGRMIGLLAAGNRYSGEGEIPGGVLQFIDACSDFVGVFHENLARYNEQAEASLGVLKALVASIDAKDPYTRGHSERVAELSCLIAAGLGFDAAQVERVRVTGLVHDIGKIGIPDWILRKPGKLDDHEFAIVKQHPETGYRILKDVPQMGDVLPGVLEHHERYDGRGYPFGLVGEGISLLGRIVAVADSFDAMCSSRAYRTGLSRQKALAEVARCAGSQYDPRLTEVFAKLDLSTYDVLLEREAAQAPAVPPELGAGGAPGPQHRAA